MLPLCPVNCACFAIVSTALKQFKGPEKGHNLFALHHYFHTTLPLPTLTISSFESPVIWLSIPYYSSSLLSSTSLKDHFTHYSIISTSYTLSLSTTLLISILGNFNVHIDDLPTPRPLICWNSSLLVISSSGLYLGSYARL